METVESCQLKLYSQPFIVEVPFDRTFCWFAAFIHAHANSFNGNRASSAAVGAWTSRNDVNDHFHRPNAMDEKLVTSIAMYSCILTEADWKNAKENRKMQKVNCLLSFPLFDLWHLYNRLFLSIYVASLLRSPFTQLCEVGRFEWLRISDELRCSTFYFHSKILNKFIFFCWWFQVTAVKNNQWFWINFVPI